LTIKLLIHEGHGRIFSFSLPDQLYEGDLITGHVDIQNDGLGPDLLMCRVVTEWNGAIYETQDNIASGAILRANIPAGVVMPAQDAIITMYAFHDEDGVWVQDDVASH